jgi:diguanylate cyclase (GGDEF)-like protein
MADFLHNAKPRILFIDKDVGSSTKKVSQLAMAGFQAVPATEEIEALASVKADKLDVACLHLPVDYMVQTDLPNVLRSVCPSGYLPVMVMADNAAERQKCRFLDSGADDVITEQTSDTEMIARLRSLLRFKHLHDELASSRAQLVKALTRERQLLTKLQADYAHMKDLATTDALTHVQNVRSFNSIMDHEFKVARRYNQAVSLLMLDVDHFKVVNDVHGHPSGDYVLKELAVILKQSVRESDIVARTGGEEFSVVLPQADRDAAAAFAERIRQNVYERKFIVFGESIHVTVSIGMATYPRDAEITEPGMLVYVADQALLRAKETGRDRAVSFHQMDDSVRRRLRSQYLDMQRQIQEDHKSCPQGEACDEIDVRSLT